MTDIPAGWYDDPENPTQYRYWDGTQWADHRSPKAHASPSGSGSSVWSVVPESFTLLGRGWRELVVLSLPLVLVTIAAGVLTLVSLDAALDPGIGDIIDRISEPGFDPVNDADDEAFFESIDLSISAASVAGVVLAVLLFLIGGTAASVSFTVFLAALRLGRPLSVGDTYRITLRRLPRIIGILILWFLVGFAALTGTGIVFVISMLITPWLLLLLVPASLAAFVYLYPYIAMATTTLSVAPVGDPPLRRTISMISPIWGAFAMRLLVLTLVFWLIGFGSNLVTTPFGGVNILGGLFVSMVLRAIQTVLSTAGSVVLYDFANGPIDPPITAGDQPS